MSQSGVFPKSTPLVLNSFVINLAFPALVLAQVPKLLHSTSLDWSLAMPISAAWIVFAGALIAFGIMGRAFGLNRSVVGALILTAGLGNTSFVGFPVIEALYGEKGLQTAVIIDQAGSFLVLSTLGLIFASYFSGSSLRTFDVMKRIATFPPFIALVIAGLVVWIDHVSGWEWATKIYSPAQKLGSTLAPLALISVGCQLRVDVALIRKKALPLALGLSYKLLIAPLLLFVLFSLFGAHGAKTTLPFRVTILEAAMGPMITGAIVAQEFGLDSEITSLMVGLGIPLSLLTIGGWYFLVENSL